MDIFELYKDKSKHPEISEILNLGAQLHPDGLAANFLEKDIWVTEILRLLFDENLLGHHATAFKGGTALSKCWKAIHRFSEDIDLSIHWADLAESEDEQADWKKTTSSGSQSKKFKKAQEKRLLEWSNNLVKTLNDRFSKYEIDGLRAELEEDSRGEKIDIHYPKIAQVEKPYQLDHVLLEFGGRNRGKPTEKHNVNTYLSEITELNALKLPEATVEAFDPQFILWEKLTALHQFSTQEVIKNPARLARHWYDVDCLLELEIVDPFSSFEAMNEVVLMKQHRWSQKGVDYEEVLSGNLRLIPEEERLETITQDHQTSVEGGLFVKDPPKFDDIINRLKEIEGRINETTKKAL